MEKCGTKQEKVEKVHEFVLICIELVVARAHLNGSVHLNGMLKSRRCQDGKCKSGKIIDEKFWEMIYNMILKLKVKH